MGIPMEGRRQTQQTPLAQASSPKAVIAQRWWKGPPHSLHATAVLP